MQELPKRERSKLANLWDVLREARATLKEHGTFVPVGFAAELLGVSKQRVCTLLNEGKLTPVFFHDQRFVSENSLVAWAKAERQVGRPCKVSAPTLTTCIAQAREIVVKK